MKATCKKHIASLGAHPGYEDEELLARIKGVGMLLSLMLLLLHCFLKLDISSGFHGITEYHKLEGTHKDLVQLPASHKTT